MTHQIFRIKMKFVTVFVSNLLLWKNCWAYNKDTFSVKLENWNSGANFLTFFLEIILF